MSSAPQPRLLHDAFGVFADLPRCTACDKPQLDGGTRCAEACCTCKGCGVEAESLDELSDEWLCRRCWVASMADVTPLPPVAGTPEWLQTLRMCEAL